MRQLTMLFFLVLAHLMYDFHWQGAFIAKIKAESWFLLGVHALTWAMLMGTILFLFKADHILTWRVPFLFATHFVVDAWKARYTRLDALGAGLWIDQALHALTLFLVIV